MYERRRSESIHQQPAAKGEKAAPRNPVEHCRGNAPKGGGGNMSSEILELYLSLAAEDKQRVAAKIAELLAAEVEATA